MARRQRFTLIGVPQHVVQRGNNRQACFYAEEDYHFYLECLADAVDKYACAIHAYVLMTNHVHLLVTPSQEYSLSQMMQSVGRRYVRYINTIYKRTGTLWEGRYKASLVQSQRYLLTCQRYIELNPVRAGMTQSPADYAWNSYHRNAKGDESELVSPHEEYLALGSDDASRQYAYRELFRHCIDDELIHDIRDSLNQELVLGNERFKDEVEEMLQRRVRPGMPGRPRVEEDGGYYGIY